MELTRTCLEHIRRVEPRVHALVTITDELALKQAQRADELIAAGDTNPLTGKSTGAGELDDTWTVRLGAEYLIKLEQYLLALTCGVGYDPAPAVDGVDDFYTVSMGAGIQFAERFNVDLAYEFRFGNEAYADTRRDISATQDVRQHRLMASMIVYF